MEGVKGGASMGEKCMGTTVRDYLEANDLSHILW